MSGHGQTLLVDYGSGNLRSAHKALTRAGFDVRVSGDPRALSGAAAVVVPGQGHFRQVMEAFRASGFEAPLREQVAAGTPVLGICVGLQLLFEGSDEAPGTPGLGLLPGHIRRFQAAPGHKVPLMGWNTLSPVGDSPLLRDLTGEPYAYFVHSYYLPQEAAIQSGAFTDYGVRFWSVLSVGNLHATQFHPEKSGRLGLELLTSFRRHVVEPGRQE